MPLGDESVNIPSPRARAIYDEEPAASPLPQGEHRVSSTHNTFVGFGFGAIQAGLFALEAQRSGRFERIVLVEVIPELVHAVRAAEGRFRVNVAHLDRVEDVGVGPVEIYDPADASDRSRIVRAIGEAAELATAVPSVGAYSTGEPSSIDRLLADGLAARHGSDRSAPPLVVYAAENQLEAAAILRGKVASALAGTPHRDAVLSGACFLDTVIGKMSAVVSDPRRIAAETLAPIAPGIDRAFLVEAFRHILVSRVERADGTRIDRCLDIFEEKVDLTPFEEAKLFGHNATHALAGYLAAALGIGRMAEIASVPGAIEFLRDAFTTESWPALAARWADVDPLFTTSGYARYGDELIDRMLNPFLGDPVARITRDPERKLGWDDRLVGVVRRARAAGVPARRYALGTVAALDANSPALLSSWSEAETFLRNLWPASAPAGEVEAILDLVRDATGAFLRWRSSASRTFPSVE